MSSTIVVYTVSNERIKDKIMQICLSSLGELEKNLSNNRINKCNILLLKVFISNFLVILGIFIKYVLSL